MFDPSLEFPNYTVVSRFVTFNGTALLELCDVNPSRIGLMFSVPIVAGDTYVMPRGVDPTANQGFILRRDPGPLLLSYRDFGALVSASWQGYCAVFPTVCAVVEVIYDPRRQGL